MSPSEVRCFSSKPSRRAGLHAGKFSRSRRSRGSARCATADTFIARERFTLDPTDESTATLRVPFATGYYASCYVISDRVPPEHPVWRAIHDRSSDTALVGASRLVVGGSTVKILAADSIALTRTLRAIRTLLADILPPLRASSDGSPISSPTEPATETAARK